MIYIYGYYTKDLNIGCKIIKLRNNMKKVLIAITLTVIILTLLYVFNISNNNSNNNLPNKSNVNTTPIIGGNVYTGTFPPPPVEPDLGIRIYPALKEGSYFLSFKEKSVTLHFTIVFEFVKGFNGVVKLRVKDYYLTPISFPFGWNGTHFVFGELEKQCKLRIARPVNYEVFFDKTEFYVGPNLNTELHVTLKIYETPIDPKIKTAADIWPDRNPNLVFVNESNFGSYVFAIGFDDYGYWNRYPEKGSGLMLVSSLGMQINLGGYIELTKELYNQLYTQYKEIMDQLTNYELKYCLKIDLTPENE